MDIYDDPDLRGALARFALWSQSQPTEYGAARHTQWQTEDGWIVGYSTEPIRNSHEHDGKFAAVAWKPNRRKDPDRWTIVYFRAFRRRKDAKARALQMFAKHSPRWAARNQETANP